MGEGADTVEGLEESFAKFDSIVSGREGKAAYDARMEAWKKDWGYLPRDRDNPLDDPFVRSTIERARARFAVDHTAAATHAGGAESYTETRRKQLLQVTGNYYLGSQYGMVAAKEVNPLDRGIRRGHDAAASYMRSAAEEAGTKELHEKAAEKFVEDNADIDAWDDDRMFLVNAPQVLDRLEMMYGDRVFLTQFCPKADCAAQGKALTPDQINDPGGASTCKTCGTATVARRPEVRKIANGCFVLIGDLKPDLLAGVFDSATRPAEALHDMLHVMGATPSTHQIDKAVNPGTPGGLISPAPLGNGDAARGLATGKGATALKALPAGHPAHSVAASAVALAEGLGSLAFGEGGTRVPEGASAQAKYETKLKAVQGRMDLIAEMRAADAADPEATAVTARLKAATDLATADAPDWNAALAAITETETLLARALRKGFEHNKLVQDALASIGTLLEVMPSYLNDTQRYNQLFDLMIQEVQMVLTAAKPFSQSDYKAKVEEVMKTRAPSLGELDPEVKIEPYLVSSGMDALTTGFVAAQKAGSDGVDRSHEAKDYFEVSGLLDHSKAVNVVGGTIVATLNPSTPTDGDQGAAAIVAHVNKRLAPDPPAMLTLVLDITLEKGGDDGKSDLDEIFRDAGIKAAIDAGILHVVMCKSYQKYAALGTGQVMAGNVTVVSKGAAFSEGSALVATSEEDLDFMNSDEGQLMTHLLDSAPAQEMEMMAHAAENARFLADMTGWAGFSEGLPFVMTYMGSGLFEGGRKIDLFDIMHEMGVERRESFSFQNSSCLPTVGTARINTGQESHEGMVEKFYAPSVLVFREMNDKKGDATTEVTPAMVNDLATREIGGAKDDALKLLEDPMPDMVKTQLANLGMTPEELKRQLTEADTPAKQMKALNILLRPSAPLDIGDVSTFRNEAQTDGLNDALGCVNSKIASALMLSGAAFDMNAPGAKDLADLRDAFVEGGMARVTPETQARLLRAVAIDKLKGDTLAPIENEATLDPAAVSDATDRRKVADETIAQVGRLMRAMPYKEDRIALLKMPELKVIDPVAREELTKMLLDGLDRASQAAVAMDFAREEGNEPELEAALARLEDSVKQAKEGLLERSETLASPDLGRDGESLVPEMSEADVAALETQVQSVKLARLMRNEAAVRAADLGALAAILPDKEPDAQALAGLLAGLKGFLAGMSLADQPGVDNATRDLKGQEAALKALRLDTAEFRNLATSLLAPVLVLLNRRIAARADELEKQRIAEAAAAAQALRDEMLDRTFATAAGFLADIKRGGGADAIVSAVFTDGSAVTAGDLQAIAAAYEKAIADTEALESKAQITSGEHEALVSVVNQLTVAVDRTKDTKDAHSRLLSLLTVDVTRRMTALTAKIPKQKTDDLLAFIEGLKAVPNLARHGTKIDDFKAEIGKLIAASGGDEVTGALKAEVAEALDDVSAFIRSTVRDQLKGGGWI